MILSLITRWRDRPFREGRDPHAFYRSTVRILASHLRRLGVTRGEDLEDIMQETYIQALRALPTLREADASVAWLLTIGRRQLYRHRERAARCGGGTADGGELDRLVADLPPHDERLQASSLCAKVVALISRVEDPVRREAIELFYLAEWQLPEIGDRLRVKTSTLTTWLSRFRETVRKELGADASESAERAGLRVATASRSGA